MTEEQQHRISPLRGGMSREGTSNFNLDRIRLTFVRTFFFRPRIEPFQFFENRFNIRIDIAMAWPSAVVL